MNKKKAQSQALIIFGASGDLAYRKLIPAIYDLHIQGSLPSNFSVLGASRTEFSNDAFREKMGEGIKEFALAKNKEEQEVHSFCKKLFYYSMDPSKSEEYAGLKERLEELNKETKTNRNYIFYLSTPPSLYPVVPKYLAQEGLNSEADGFKRVIIEKPFGIDYNSAVELNKGLLEDYNEEQIYRIDHYLGKETVQNIFVTRFANGIYEPLWNRNYIHHVEVTVAESIGIGNRGGFYENAGALKDMIQNHLLQMVALVAMEPPMSLDSASIRNEKQKVFQALRPLSDKDLIKNVIRGQYLESNINGKYYKAYRDENGVNPESRTETYLAMKLFIDNWRWGGVPFYIRTGKRLPTRVSEIVIHFKPTPHNLFVENKEFCNEGNRLILRIQPNEGILLKTGMKIPGSGYHVKEINMDFQYSDLSDNYIPEAYERLLLDCMIGDSTLYIRGDALESTWKFVQPLIDFLNNNPDAPLYGYPSGTWGPENADSLIKGATWRYPCKNLSDDGIYCEL